MNKFLKHYYAKKRRDKLVTKPVKKPEKPVVKELSAVGELYKLQKKGNDNLSISKKRGVK